MSTAAGVAAQIDLSKTADCTFVTVHFTMGIGKMRQVKGLKVETTADVANLRHQKKLIDSPELEEIRSQDGYLKRALEAKSCSYDESTRFIPNVWLEELDRMMIAYETIRRPALVAKFMKEYRKLESLDFEPLREGLGDQFNHGDYPPAEVVEKGFSFSYYYRVVGQIQLNGVSNVILNREVEKDRHMRTAAIIEWRNAMRQMALGMVDNLIDVLKPDGDGRRKKLYDSTVDKLSDFLKTYDTRDLANDAECQQHVAAIRQIMKGVNVEKLRESESLKDSVAEKLQGVKMQLATLVEVQPGRRFRDA